MEKTNELKSRLNRSFGIACLFSVVSTVITVIATVIYLIVMVIPEMVQVPNSFYDKADFYILFVLPQLLLPLLTAGVSFLIPIINREKFSESIRKKRVPIHYFLLCALAFPGLSTVFSYVSYYISYVLSLIGIPVLDVSSVIPQPEGALEIFLLFFVMAVLPAICEELIYRGFLLSGISKYGKGGAILVTSIAFGLMHATIQQIPFAFFVGLILAYLAVRFDSLILPMVLHFINNFISCLFTLLQFEMNTESFEILAGCIDVAFMILMLLSVAIFIILTINDKKNKIQISEISEEDFEADVAKEKANFFSAVVHSWGFWLFTAIYLVTTIVNIVATAFSYGI